MLNILVVEDNIDLGTLICSELEKNCYIVSFAENGEKAIELFNDKHFDLLITDIMMPKTNGIELISYVRSINKNIPILIISAKSSQEDKYKGFNVGTDDYMVKPIDIDELILRVNALLRRAKILNDRKLTIGGAILDYDTYSVTIDGETSILPQKQFQILFKLLSYPDTIFTRNQLMEEFWDINTDSDEMTIYTHIHRLREKYQNCQYFEIVTIRNLGYKGVIK
ncbi:MAG: response regulator transcription factor [Clostridiales bacterium]|nr:response regulator transcription factor [Clostridiales bacterium]